MCHISIFIFSNCFVQFRVMVDLEAFAGTLDVRWDNILEGHQSLTITHSFSKAYQHVVICGGERNLENLDCTHEDKMQDRNPMLE